MQPYAFSDDFFAEKFALFHSAFERCALGMAIVSTQGQWLHVNTRLAQLLGYEREELTRLTFQEVTHPDDLESDLQLVGELLDGQRENYDLEKRYLRKDGSIFWGALHVSLVRGSDGDADYFISQIEDISARKAGEVSLEKSRAIKAAVIETALDAVIIMDGAGLVREWNPAAEAIFGWSREQVLGHPLDHFIVPPELRGAHERGIARFLATGESEILGRRLELPAVHADGRRLTVELAVIPIPGVSPPLFAGHLRDISTRKQSEEALRRQAQLLRLTHDAILVHDRDGRILFWNEGATQLYGFSEEQALGRVAQTLLQTQFPAPLQEILQTVEATGLGRANSSTLAATARAEWC